MSGINSKQMSRLYREARRKGFRHNSAFKAVGTAKALSKKNINSRALSLKRGKYKNLDFDGDRKVNKYDCKPLDKHKQDDIDVSDVLEPGDYRRTNQWDKLKKQHEQNEFKYKYYRDELESLKRFGYGAAKGKEKQFREEMQLAKKELDKTNKKLPKSYFTHD